MEQKPQRDWLQKIEYIGNKLPDITILFVYALAICWLLSWALSYIDFDYINPSIKKNSSLKAFSNRWKS